MARDLSFEHFDFTFFATIRTVCSRLWLINNPELYERILAYLARYQEQHGVIIYAFIIMGNHYHLLACFPRGNKAAFFRDFNGMFSKLTHSKVKEFEGGKLWARRVRTQVVPNSADIVDKFFYTALNPVSSGLVEKLSEYPAYNSFADAIYQRKRTYKVTNWHQYNSRKRFNPKITEAECTTVHTLSYSLLPGFEHLSRKQYVDRMNRELEARRQQVVKEREKKGLGFATREALLRQKIGTKPRTTKTSKRDTHRPLVLTACMETKERFLNWYFSLLQSFKEASLKFRQGAHSIVFPPGTYRPPSCCPCTAS